MPHPINSLNTLRMVQGQTKVISVKVKQANGRLAKLSGAKMFFSLRKKASGPVLIAKTIDDGIEITNGDKGEAVITLDINDTNLASGEYRYDVWTEFPGDPPVRQPVVKNAQLYVVNSLTDFT